MRLFNRQEANSYRPLSKITPSVTQNQVPRTILIHRYLYSTLEHTSEHIASLTTKSNEYTNNCYPQLSRPQYNRTISGTGSLVRQNKPAIERTAREEDQQNRQPSFRLINFVERSEPNEITNYRSSKPSSPALDGRLVTTRVSPGVLNGHLAARIPSNPVLKAPQSEETVGPSKWPSFSTHYVCT